MVTYRQLESEDVYNREFVTPAMREYHEAIIAGLDIPRNRVGAKGNNLHLWGGHRSQNWIRQSRYCTDRSNTVQLGIPTELGDAIAATDIGPPFKQQLIELCRRTDNAARAGLIEPLRAWYGNVDGDRIVDGWNNVANRLASADESHLAHWHGTHDRFSLNNYQYFRRLAAIQLGTAIPEDGPPPRRLNVATLYYQDKRGVWALAGDSPGTPANWLEVFTQAQANALAAVHGSAIVLPPPLWELWREAYKAPVSVAVVVP